MSSTVGVFFGVTFATVLTGAFVAGLAAMTVGFFVGILFSVFVGTKANTSPTGLLAGLSK